MSSGGEAPLSEARRGQIEESFTAAWPARMNTWSAHRTCWR